MDLKDLIREVNKTDRKLAAMLRGAKFLASNGSWHLFFKHQFHRDEVSKSIQKIEAILGKEVKLHVMDEVLAYCVYELGGQIVKVEEEQ